jgi:hypothetical protein
MKIKYKNTSVMIKLLMIMSMVSCGGGVDTDINFTGGNVSFPQFRNTDFKAEEPFSKEVAIVNQSRLRLKGANDKISITGISGAVSVMITGMKRVKSSSTEDASEHLSALEVNVQSLADEIFVETILPEVTGGRGYEADYSITLPKDLEIKIINMNRNVTINAIDNNITVNNVNGDVTLTDIFGSAVIRLVNGTIESEVTLPLNGTIGLRTVNGNIKLTIPSDTSARFSADVNIGNINMSYLVLNNNLETENSLSGIFGSGQGSISLDAEATGNINVSGI